MRKDKCNSCGGLKDKRAIECNPCRFKNRHPRYGTGKSGKGKTINAGGYVVLNESRQYEHRSIMEKTIGRKLLSNEHVHHKNGIRSDNRIENLELLTDKDHAREHMTSDVAKKRSKLGHAARWGV